MSRTLIAWEAWWDAGRGIVALAAPGLVAAAAVYAVLLRWTDWTAARVGWRPAALRGFVTGGAWGCGLALVVLGLAVAGGARIAFRDGGPAYLAAAAPVALGLLIAAALEELLFRGFPVTRLAETTGRVAASGLVSLVFVVAHFGNPDVSALAHVNIGLASLLLCAVYFSGSGLAGAVGLHAGWNATLALAADAPVSGLRFALPGPEYTPGAYGLVTGGRFGPEGGLVATVALAGALVWWVRRHLKEAERS